MSTTNIKLRVLALHGYRQSDVTFRAKLGSLRKSFKNEIDFTFIKAPLNIPNVVDVGTEATLTNEYAWWFSDKERNFILDDPCDLSVGFKESVSLIEKTFEQSGPFDGIFGFSQGAAFTALLCCLQQKKLTSLKFDFAIMVAGFKSFSKDHAGLYDEMINLPSLHVFGLIDQITPRAVKLSECFANAKIVQHKGGHYVPGEKNIYKEFITEMLMKKYEGEEKSNAVHSE